MKRHAPTDQRLVRDGVAFSEAMPKALHTLPYLIHDPNLSIRGLNTTDKATVWARQVNQLI